LGAFTLDILPLVERLVVLRLVIRLTEQTLMYLYIVYNFRVCIIP
jgi:hypothetical protein